MKQLALILFCHLTLFGQLCAEDFPSFANCDENGCKNLDIFGPLNIELDFGLEGNDCLNCDSNHLSVRGIEDANPELIEDVTELIKVGLLAEFLASRQSESDKAKHIRAGAYIGYFSSGSCKHGPKLLQLNFRINKTGQFFCALVGASVAGLLKEAYDSTDRDNHTVDAMDAFATSLGALSNVPLYRIQF
jgi:hypothetical protein